MRACDDNDDGCDGGQTDEYVTIPPYGASHFLPFITIGVNPLCFK